MVQIEIPDRDLVAGLEKGLAVIEAFDAAHTKLTVVDVAKMTGLTRAAARRYLLTLVKNGYAAYDGKFFSLLPRVLGLGYAYLSSATLAFRVQPILERISAKTQLRSCLRRDGGYLHRSLIDRSYYDCRLERG